MNSRKIDKGLIDYKIVWRILRPHIQVVVSCYVMELSCEGVKLILTFGLWTSFNVETKPD